MHRPGGARRDRDVRLRRGRAQLPRLLELIMAIQSDRFPNARTLAERCEVSRRTIYRDLDTLDAAGIPVRYRPDRQGYQLARSCALPLAEPRREGGRWRCSSWPGSGREGPGWTCSDMRATAR